MGTRVIKKSICTNPKIAQLSWFEEVVFYRLIVNADDYGCMDGRPEIVRQELFTVAKKVTLTSISLALEKLNAVGLIECVAEKERPVIRIKSWGQHQRTRAEKSQYLPQKEAEELQKLVDLYNQCCPRLNTCLYASENTQKLFMDMRKYGYDDARFKRLFETANKSDFLAGRGKNGWMAYLDWLLIPANAEKVLAGVYGTEMNQKKKDAGFVDIDNHDYTKQDYEDIMNNLSGFHE